MNKVILSGRICKDIELRYTPSNKAVIQNTIAVRNNYKNENGEYDSQFINIVVWKQTAEILSKYAMKGSKILIEGRIANRSYDKQDGTKAYVTEVIVERLELIDTTKEQSKPAVEETSKQVQPKPQNDPFADFGDITVTMDDLPF